MHKIGCLLLLVAAVLCASASFDAAPAAANGSFIPVFGDDYVACVNLPESTWFATPGNATALANATGETPQSGTAASFLASVPNAGTGHLVRVDGGYFSGNARQVLTNKGYASEESVEPLEGASGAIRYSQ
jgi:hypothetical protein